MTGSLFRGGEAMKTKQENVIRFFSRFAHEDRNKMISGVILAVLSELAGILPYLSAATLRNGIRQM
jgi:hypothetical protein